MATKSLIGRKPTPNKPAAVGRSGYLVLMVGGKKKRMNLVGLRSSGALRYFRPALADVRTWTREAGLKSAAIENWLGSNNKHAQDQLKAKLEEFRSFLRTNEQRATQTRPATIPAADWTAYGVAMLRLKTVFPQAEEFAKKNLVFVVGTIVTPPIGVPGQTPGITLDLSPVTEIAPEGESELEVETASMVPEGFFGSLWESMRAHPGLWALGTAAAAVGGVYLWKHAPKDLPPSEKFLREQEEF